MSGKPIDEAVAMLEALQERWCASTAGKDGSRRIATFDPARGARGEDDFDNEVSATRRCASDLALAIERIRALTAAQKQGQAVACRWPSCECPNGTAECPKRTAPPPSAPVGVDGTLSVFSAGEWRYSETGQTFSAKDLDEAAFVVYRDRLAQQPAASAVALTVCCGREECGGECGNEWRGMEWVRITQQPAAVDEAMVERACKAAVAQCAPDEVWPEDYEGADELRATMRAALTAALATQHQEPKS